MREFIYNDLYLIPLFPLIGAFLWGVFGKKLGRTVVNWLAPGAIFVSACIATIAVVRLYLEREKLGQTGDDVYASAMLVQNLFTWIGVADLKIDMVLTIDPLTSVMAMVVLWISFLIHVYSVGYMAHDESYWRFFSYLNLFVFAMLLLILGGNLAILFVGWEGVGLCSYLLIGFWYEDEAKAQAGLKAFVVNRVGDFGFLVGMFALFSIFGTINFAGLEAAVGQTPDMAAMVPAGVFQGWTYGSAVTFACLALFVGACGKSAQIPLYVWLPDAMAGPTPVSALIHAATMVTAGVYMVVRLNYLFALSSTAMMVIAITGALTAIFAATIGMAQNDIKKVLAYSTVSQLGYMFLATGVGAWWVAVFHLMTHAFFKACLFLGSGSVIHGCSGEQDIREMGGLRKYMPFTAYTMGFATMAIMGFPLFSGFFSKDEILWLAFASPRGGLGLWVIGFLAAGLTSFYMWRMMLMTFSGDAPRGLSEKARSHLHESPFTMVMPLVVLAVLSVLGGLVGVPHVFHVDFISFTEFFPQWLDTVFATAAAHPANAALFASTAGGMNNALQLTTHGAGIEIGLMVGSITLALGGAFVAYRLYNREPAAVTYSIPKMSGIGGIYRTLLNKYWVDEVYAVFPIGATRVFARFCDRVVDVIFVDGLITKVAPFVVRVVASVVAWWQNGDTQRYLAFIVFGVAVALYFAL